MWVTLVFLALLLISISFYFFHKMHQRFSSFVVAMPLLFSLLFMILNYMWILGLQSTLAPVTAGFLDANKGSFLLMSSLIFLPNFILSFFIWVYIRTDKDRSQKAFWLCLCSILGGLLPNLFIYLKFYSAWEEYGTQLSIILFGLPFVYLTGMMIGWVIGLLVASLFAK